jgi:hypothetical protein
MRNFVFWGSLFALTHLAFAASAGTLVVSPSSEDVVVTQWNHREVATRNWLGCREYDFLQGTGWYSSTWHNDFESIFDDYENAYTFETKRTWRQRYCASEMDQYNYVQVEWIDANGTVLHGRFSIVPGGQSDDVEIECSVSHSNDPYNAITCDDAVVSWRSGSTVYVDIIWEP